VKFDTAFEIIDAILFKIRRLKYTCQ